jgi:cytochrome d ubiquinol oxidase subunit I
MAPSGLLAVLAGWFTTEVGRQPWTIQGLLLTAKAASPLDAPAVALSLLAFVVVYFLVFGAGVVYALRLMAKPPMAQESQPPAAPARAAGVTPAAALHGQRPQPKP